VAAANSDKATVVVAGEDVLVPGLNTVTITVTAESGASASYTFTVDVGLSGDNSLDAITVNGKEVAVSEVLTVSFDTTSVVVLATANDASATVTIAGADNLTPGDNTVTVTITAANGDQENYTFVVRVPTPSTNANLSYFNVNGVDALEDQSIDVATDVTEAEIIAQTEEANASFEVTSSTALSVGANTITVVVTAQDGTTTRTYSVTVNRAAPLSGDTSLDTVTVDGTTIEVGDTVDVAFGTSSVTVIATPTNENATALVSGNSDLKTGDNFVTIVVTAENGTTAEFTFTVKVAQSNDNTLTGITVNGSSISLEDLTFTVPSGTTSVVVAATPNDVEASYAVTGQDELEYGPNTVTITVTAANGATRDYEVVVTRTPLSGNNNVGLITVNGNTVVVDGTFTVDNGTTSVEVLATAEDTDASVEVSDSSALVTGNNVITITVTAANGAEATYEITVFVKSLSNDTSLKVFTADGTEVDGEEFSLVLDGTKDFVAVVAQANDANAVVAIEGTTNLTFGENDVLVTVTAEDGTVATYTFVVVYPNIGDTSLKTFTVNGTSVDDGDRVEFEYGVTDVEVIVETTDPDATADISGAEGLVPGENELLVTVTAKDGETIQEYLVIVFVAFNTDSTLATFQVNGEDVVDEAVVTLPAYTTEVEVTADPTDPEATVEINGATELNVGENLLIVTVTAADGVNATDYVITLIVPLGNNVELTTFTVAGIDVADGDTLDLEPYTFNPEIVIEPTDPDATFVLTGGTDLVVGLNTITLVVTAADATTTATYTVTLNLLLGNNVELSSLQINGTDAFDGDNIVVDYGTTEVDIAVVTVDADATVEIVGGTDLQPGENTVTVNVTAADGETTAAYTVTVTVALNNDASLAVFAVNGNDVVDGETIELEYGVTSVEVVADPTDPDATVEISGNTDLVSGENTLTVTVTAADGETVVEYLVTLLVALNSDTSLAVFQVNGVDVVDGGSVDLPAYTTDAEVTVETTDGDATVEIEGGSELTSGENTLTVTVTAADQETVTVYTVTLVVALGNDVTYTSFQVNGEDVEDGGSITVTAALTSVEVLLELTDPDATFEVSGSDNIVIGTNLITVVVTAADGSATATYTVTVVVLSNDTSLAEFTVDGSPVDDGDYFELPLGTTSVEIVVVANDEGATFEIDGGQDLQPGENTLTVTVTAADGETTKEYVVNLFVLLSDDTSLASFKVNGVDVEDGSDVELPPYTTDVEVEVEATNADAQVDIVGADSLQAGENRLEVTVTAADGETVQVYVVSIYVLLSTEVGVSEIIVNGESVQSGEVVLSLDLELTEVDVEVITVDENAVVEISGNTELVKGDNLITILVTAQSGDVGEYSVTFRLGGLPGNPKLKSLIVAGNTIDLTVAEPAITVPAGTKSVAVIPTAEEEAASIRVTGNSNLVAGENTVTVKVTATDGKTTREYLVKVNVLELSSNTNVSSIKVNGVAVLDGGSVTLVAGAKFAEVVAVAEDDSATITYSGTKNLVAGNNTATVTVRAASGASATYNLVLVVPSLSNDTTLKVLSIEGFNMLNKTRLSVPAGTTKLRITAQANSAGASVSIAGRDIKAGVNFVVITVTAADGTVATYTVRVKA
ncbi:MAG: beta strand repeat-containing protein, partial [Rhodoluna sp.]